MIIRVGFLDTDESYIARLANYYGAHQDKTTQLEVHLYTDAKALKQQSQRGGRLDVLIAEESLLDEPEEYARTIALAFWSEDKHEQSRNGYPAVCKYQKATDIFRIIQSLAAQQDKKTSNYALSENGRVLLYLAGSGGAGCSTAAIGCASWLAAQGKNVIYFSLKQSEEEKAFRVCGNSMTDVRYELGLWRQLGGTDYGQFQLKLQSMLKRDDETGVSSFEAFDMPVSAMNLEPADIEGLLSAVRGICDVCVVSIDSYISPALLKAIRLAEWVVVVSNSTPIGNEKMCKLLNSLEVIDSMDEKLFQGNVGVIYNRFGHDAKKANLPSYVHELGVIPKYQNAARSMITNELTNSKVYTQLISGAIQ